jgi:hypothetical protein
LLLTCYSPEKHYQNNSAAAKHTPHARNYINFQNTGKINLRSDHAKPLHGPDNDRNLQFNFLKTFCQEKNSRIKYGANTPQLRENNIDFFTFER